MSFAEGYLMGLQIKERRSQEAIRAQEFQQEFQQRTSEFKSSLQDSFDQRAMKLWEMSFPQYQVNAEGDVITVPGHDVSAPLSYLRDHGKALNLDTGSIDRMFQPSPSPSATGGPMPAAATPTSPSPAVPDASLTQTLPGGITITRQPPAFKPADVINELKPYFFEPGDAQTVGGELREIGALPRKEQIARLETLRNHMRDKYLEHKKQDRTGMAPEIVAQIGLPPDPSNVVASQRWGRAYSRLKTQETLAGRTPNLAETWLAQNRGKTIDDFMREQKDIAAEEPTSTSRTMGETAATIIPHVEQMKKDIAAVKGDLGPIQGRWNDFWTGKIGTNDPKFARLLAEKDLLTTAIVRMHMGARGGQMMVDHFAHLLDTSNTPANLAAKLDVVEDYAQGYAEMGSKRAGKGQQEPAAAAPPNGKVTASPTPAKYGFSVSRWKQAHPRANPQDVKNMIDQERDKGFQILP